MPSWELLREFVTWGFDNRSWAKTTRERYRGQVRRADGWLTEHRSITVVRAGPLDLSALMSTLSPNPSTRNNARNALVGWYDFLVDRGSRRDNPATQLPRHKLNRPIPRSLSPDETRRILDAARVHGPMWHAAVVLLLHQGMRSSEARLLEWARIEESLDESWVMFTAKGGQQRIMPLHPETAAALTTWRLYCRSPRWVFPSPRRHDRPVSEAWWKRVVAAIGEEAGVDNVHPHRFRHTFAIRLLEQGADIAAVRDLMGHADLSTTSIYLKSRPARLRQQLSRLDHRAS